MVVHVESNARIHIIPELKIFALSSDGEIDFDSESLKDDYLRQRIPEFPCLLTSDGSPWLESNTYLLESVCQRINFSIQTLQSISNDLLRFLRFLETENIDFKRVPKRRPGYPIHRFSYELSLQVKAGDLASKTAERCVDRTQRFYDWLIDQGVVSEKFSSRSNNRAWGGERNRFGSSGVNEAKRALLLALTSDQQKCLVEYLREASNIEMKFIIAVGLLTGMRLQSVLTLKRSVLKILEYENRDFCSIRIGEGTGIDSKKNKNMIIYFPSKLVQQLDVYCSGKRARNRRHAEPSGRFKDYVFLTGGGKPYYITKLDREYSGNKCRNQGAAVGKYIRENIAPKTGIKFSFNCIRATYSMNCVDSQLALVEAGKITLHEARNFVRERLGHAETETTDEYLNIRKYTTHKKQLQSNHESRLLEVFDE